MARPRCPQCKKEIQWQRNVHRPFCSERCKLVDLGKWVTEEYAIRGEPVNLEQLREKLIQFPAQKK